MFGRSFHPAVLPWTCQDIQLKAPFSSNWHPTRQYSIPNSVSFLHGSDACRLSPITDRNPDKIALANFDDTCLLVVSPDREKNCRALKSLHDDWIMNWAGEGGVTFEPDKYAVMHFQKPWSRHECDLLPHIEGLTKNALKTEMRILGVIVDNRLTWQAHVEHVRPIFNGIRPMPANKLRSNRRCERL